MTTETSTAAAAVERTALVTWTVRYLRTDSPAWTTAASELTETEAGELVEALRATPHIFSVSVTQRVAAGAHGSVSGVSVHPGPDQDTCPLCIAYIAYADQV